MEKEQSVVVSFLLICSLSTHIGLTNAEIPDNSIIFTAKSNATYFISNTEEWLDDTSVQLHLTRIVTNMRNSSGLAYDSHLQAVIQSDPGQSSIFLLNASSYGGVIYHIGTSNGVGQLTVDWRAHNIYWADSVYGWIAMQGLPRDIRKHNSLQTSFKLVVEKYLHTPTGIAVHPHKYHLFWADAGPQPKIEKSNLIGEGREIIAWAGLITPTSLCIDQSNDRLYWTDPLRGTVEYSDFNGHNRNILISNSQKDFYGLAVFKNTIVVTVPSKRYIETYDGTTGERKTVPRQTEEPLYSIVAYSSANQHRDQAEGCDLFHKECDHICTHMEQDRGYTCLCDDGFNLEGDGQTCAADINVLERYILYTNNTSICGISINVLNIPYDLLTPACDIIQHNKPITKFAVDMMSKMIFYTDGNDIFKDIVFSQDPEHLGSADDVTDLDYNWKSKELIWTDQTDGKIYAINVGENEQKERVILENLQSPTSVAVDPHDRRIYWISEAAMLPQLHVLNENGSVSRVGTSFMNDPVDLEYDRLNERLLWADIRGHIGMINVDGSNERKTEVQDTLPDALSGFKKYIICSDSKEDSYVLSVIQEPDNIQWLISNQLFDSTYISDIHVFDSSLQPSDLEPCEDNNGGCEQLCLPQDNKRCGCKLGYHLHVDGVSCTTTTSGSNFYMVTDTMYTTIYQIDTEGHSMTRAVEIEPDNEPISLSYNSDDNTVYWVDKKSRSVKMKSINGSREKSLGIDVSEFSNIAIDVTGGNIYVTKSNEILLFTLNNDVKTILQKPDIKGQPGKIAIAPSAGTMVWTEYGTETRIVKANMDGTTVKEIVTDDIDTPSDIVIDQYATGNALYWSDSALQKIETVDLDSLTRQVAYHNQDLDIIAIDVKDDHLFFLAAGHRKIFRIDKATGSGYTVVVESALLGTLAALYVWKPAQDKHELCSDCTNGGCSAICLPRSDGRSCACADGISLGSDSKTCNNVDRCSTVISDSNIERLDQCCVPISNRVCDYTCKPGFENSPNPLYCQANGRWNLSLKDACVKAETTKLTTEDSTSNIALYAGAGGGAAVLLLVVGVICICRKRNQKQHQRSRLLSLPSITDVNPSGGDINSQSPFYRNGISNQDPPRPLTDENHEDGVEYDYLDESMIAKTVDLPPENPNKSKGINKEAWQSSGRYTHFPPSRDAKHDGKGTSPDDYYLSVMPDPDYDKDSYQTEAVSLPAGASASQQAPWEEDGYLQSSSFSRNGQTPCLPPPRKELKENATDGIEMTDADDYVAPSPNASMDLGYMCMSFIGSQQKAKDLSQQQLEGVIRHSKKRSVLQVLNKT